MEESKWPLEEILYHQGTVIDEGFCSKENLQFMCEKEINFITRLPKGHKVFLEFIQEAGTIETAANAVKYSDRVVFVKSKKTTLYAHEIYVHVILDPSKKGKDTNMILKDRLDDEIDGDDLQELDKKMQSAGFFILLSRHELGRADILPSYYTRQAIEQVFGFAKSNNNLLPLRVHNEQSIKGYLTLAFIALIIFLTMRQKIKLPMDKALLNLRSLKAKIFDNQIIMQESNENKFFYH